MLKVNGVEMPTPSGMVPMMYDITEAERDSTGTMHIDLVATKYKLECSWNYLTQEDMTKLLKAIKSITFSITFTDPEDGNDKTISVYKGDRSIPILRVIDGKNTYKDFKVNFIEL
ncbi:hypothetical protein QTL86_12735 [Cellulosilyticum sp. ST5]|uniref:DUF6711 family protein n=1 Tax=Cellulosilyticum sp. ST5 TaxID=3055805 RepID=UPI0039777756